jgi:hypothetical protein
MIEYGHVEQVFGHNFSRIQVPVEISAIPFNPAEPRGVTKIIHSPTRRGFKGSTLVLQAIEMLKARRTDFYFKIVEGLPFSKYIDVMSEADIVIDQVYSQSPGMNALEMMAAGKIVFTGATPLGASYFDFMADSPAIDAPPNAPELAEAISLALDRRNEFRNLAERGRAYVETNHSPHKVAQLFVSEWAKRI